MNRKLPTEERIVDEWLFDEEFRAYIDWKDQISERDGQFIMAAYRAELLRADFANFSSYVSTSTGEEYKTVRVYDNRRLEYVKEKINKRFGSIEALQESITKMRKGKLMSFFKDGLIQSVDEAEEQEKYNILEM